jgi:ribulose bisphosphate carboxylase small subunit
MEFLAKLYFARHEGERVVAELLEAQRAACRDWLAELEAQVADHTNQYARLVYQFRIGQMEAVMAWIELCEQTLLP